MTLEGRERLRLAIPNKGRLVEPTVELLRDAGLVFEEHERSLVARVGHVDVLVGGPPCQGHSNLNNHTRRKDPKNKLYERMARFAELVKPTHIIIENVSAVLHDEGKVVKRTIEHLKALDYEVDGRSGDY